MNIVRAFILCTACIAVAAHQPSTASAEAAAAAPAQPDNRPGADPGSIVITDIPSWQHPTKAVFAKYQMKLTKVVLLHHAAYPVFHVADFGADPTSEAASDTFNPFLLALLKANGFHSFEVVEDSNHDGFAVSYDKRKRTIHQDLLEDAPS